MSVNDDSQVNKRLKVGETQTIEVNESATKLPASGTGVPQRDYVGYGGKPVRAYVVCKMTSFSDFKS